MTTTPNGHAPALAAPQSHVGKTSSFMIPPILSTFDRVVVTTTKPDMVGATTLARGRGRQGRTDVVQPPLTDLPIPDLTCWAQHAQQYDWWARQYLVAKQRWEYR